MNETALERLRNLVRSIAAEAAVPTGHVEWALGFAVLDCPQTFRYEMTPRDSRMFGVTGGDGVHFVELPDTANGLVVMVSPAAFVQHVVLGESVEEFMRLGYYNGFGWLEDLAYPKEGNASEHYARSPTPDSPLGPRVVLALREAFALSPIDDIRAYLHGLRRRHLQGVKGRVQRASQGA